MLLTCVTRIEFEVNNGKLQPPTQMFLGLSRIPSYEREEECVTRLRTSAWQAREIKMWNKIPKRLRTNGWVNAIQQ